MSETELLRLSHVSHVYDSGDGKSNPAVRDISFSIRRGETFGLVGESGCGKSTTGRMIVRLLPVTSGTITYDGQDISALQGRRQLLDFRSKVQMIFQDPYASLDPRMKVRDIVAEGLRLHKRCHSEEELSERVNALLKEVGLKQDHATRYPHEFSGGQRQRIGIARALALEPEFIVCDEPISALDVSIQAQVINLLRRLQAERRFTYLFIAHDLSMVRFVSDRIAVMCQGKIVELGEAEEVYSNPQHAYTKSLISAIPLPDPLSERQRKRTSWIPTDLPDRALTEVSPGHFVLI